MSVAQIFDGARARLATHAAPARGPASVSGLGAVNRATWGEIEDHGRKPLGAVLALLIADPPFQGELAVCGADGHTAMQRARIPPLWRQGLQLRALANCHDDICRTIKVNICVVRRLEEVVEETCRLSADLVGKEVKLELDIRVSRGKGGCVDDR